MPYSAALSELADRDTSSRAEPRKRIDGCTGEFHAVTFVSPEGTNELL